MREVSREELEKIVKDSCGNSKKILEKIDKIFGVDEKYLLFELEGCCQACFDCYCIFPLPMKIIKM